MDMVRTDENSSTSIAPITSNALSLDMKIPLG
jgi:hypothetical protein